MLKKRFHVTSTNATEVFNATKARKFIDTASDESELHRRTFHRGDRWHDVERRVIHLDEHLLSLRNDKGQPIFPPRHTA